MTSPNVPRNAYTDAPEQHPNLIIGSLQLLWWMIIHPSAFRNHLTRIDPDLTFDSSLLILIRKKRWRLLIQGNLILPVLAGLVLALVLCGLGFPPARVAGGVAVGVAGGVAVGVALGIAGGVAAGVAAGVAVDVAVGVAVGVALGVAVGVAVGVALGVAAGVAWDVGITINIWLPVLLYPFLTVCHTLLYRLDKLRTSSKPSLLRYHSAFWDEWQRLPLHNLDQHVLLVLERNSDEGKAALSYLSTSRQRWAAQAVQIELDARYLENCADVKAISDTHRTIAVGELNSPVKTLLSSFSHISQDVDAAINQGSANNQRLALSIVSSRT